MAQPRWLSDTQQRVWRTYLQASQQLAQQLDADLQRDAGLPLAYYQTLVMLSEAPDRTLRMSALAARTWSSRSRLSHAVDRLTEKGWVRRLVCPGDKRGAYAQLTDAGFAVLEAAAPSHVDSVQRHLFDLLSEAQVGDLEAISARIAANLACPAEPDPG
jgi:DNA-binding MarR family transcriptional regulator